MPALRAGFNFLMCKDFFDATTRIQNIQQDSLITATCLSHLMLNPCSQTYLLQKL